MMTKENIDNLIAICNEVKAVNDYPPSILVSRSTYEKHKNWLRSLYVDVLIINPTAEFKENDKIYIVPHNGVMNIYE